MAVLRLQVNNGSSFLVHRLKKSALDGAEVSAMVAAKLRSPLVLCPRCPEGCHPQETICFSPEAADGTTLAIMVQLLEGHILDPTHFPFLDARTEAQYFLTYMSDEVTLHSPTTLKGIEQNKLVG